MSNHLNGSAITHLIDPVAWAEDCLGFHPEPLQAEILRSTSNHLLLCCSRQFGKSTLTAIKALHHAWFHPNATILVAAPSERQAGEWILKSRGFLAQLGVRPRSDGFNEFSLALPNRARLIGLPGVAATTRGFSSVSLLIFEEAAFVPDDLYAALVPSLARSGGALWLISTPNGQSGFFHTEWHAPAAHWQRFRVAADQVPSIKQEFLDRYRLAYGEQALRREFFCEFTASGEQIFDRSLLDESFSKELFPWNL